MLEMHLRGHSLAVDLLSRGESLCNISGLVRRTGRGQCCVTGPPCLRAAVPAEWVVQLLNFLLS